MAKILTNIHNNKTYVFDDKFEKVLINLKEVNMHSEVRLKIARKLGLYKYADKFKIFCERQFNTAEQLSERYDITKEFLCCIKFLFGQEAVDYINQYL